MAACIGFASTDTSLVLSPIMAVLRSFYISTIIIYKFSETIAKKSSQYTLSGFIVGFLRSLPENPDATTVGSRYMEPYGPEQNVQVVIEDFSKAFEPGEEVPHLAARIIDKDGYAHWVQTGPSEFGSQCTDFILGVSGSER